MSRSGQYDVITLEGLRKVYSGDNGATKTAVHDLWLGIPQGECFGYLGINVSSSVSGLVIVLTDACSVLRMYVRALIVLNDCSCVV